MADPRRIYVASLHDYNAGRLHGVFIDLADYEDGDEIDEKVQAMLAASPEFKAFPAGGPAEEYEIHDHEGWGGLDPRYMPWSTLIAIDKLMDDRPPVAVAHWLSDYVSPPYSAIEDELEDKFDEGYRGEWSSEAEFAADFVDNCGWAGLEPKQIEAFENYINWEGIAEALFAGDYESIPDPTGGIFVFEPGAFS